MLSTVPPHTARPVSIPKYRPTVLTYTPTVITIRGTLTYIKVCGGWHQLTLLLNNDQSLEYWSRREHTIKRFLDWYSNKQYNIVTLGTVVCITVCRATAEIHGFQ
jgi:hypothetical protein